jgi:hypothetical protein
MNGDKDKRNLVGDLAVLCPASPSRPGTLKRFSYAVMLLLTARFGCGDNTSERQARMARDVEAAKKYVHLLQLRAFSIIEADADASISGPEMQGSLSKMADLLPDADSEAESLALVGTSTLQTPNGQETTITLECHHAQNWLLADITTRTTYDGKRILGFYLKPIPDSVARMKRFAIFGKGVKQYAVLLLSFLCLSITAYALYLCLRTTTGKAKWLYPVLILLGVGQLGVDWTTGKTSITLLAFHLPPVWAISPPYSPWLVYVSVPVGALIFVLRQKERTA